MYYIQRRTDVQDQKGKVIILHRFRMPLTRLSVQISHLLPCLFSFFFAKTKLTIIIHQHFHLLFSIVHISSDIPKQSPQGPTMHIKVDLSRDLTFLIC